MIADRKGVVFVCFFLEKKEREICNVLPVRGEASPLMVAFYLFFPRKGGECFDNA